MIRLSQNQILMMHSELIMQTQGRNGLRDKNLFESAVEQPFQMFDDKYLYSSLQEKAARLCYGLVKNHAFIDGNKRIGVHAMLVFLALNNCTLKYTQEELSNVIMSLAADEIGEKELLKWTNEHSKNILLASL